MLLIRVTPLRRGGARLPSPAWHAQGYLKSERAGVGVALRLVSNVGGATLCGPLFDARVTRADIDGITLLGLEREGSAAFVQEWHIGPAESSFNSNGWPVPS